VVHAGDKTCFDPWAGVNKETKHDGDFWDYQYCTEMFMPMARSGKDDMFWSEPWNETAAREACRETWGVEPRISWPTVVWGGRQLQALSNVVFSNGLYDPWHGGGVLKDLSDTVKVCTIYFRNSCSRHV
jgi:lysosomal Pro-X carboxypeptidase